jgi:DHA1 family bicyclomycin/chloramphenicol resistance-like MFS transporter
MAFATLVYGSLADRYGRRPVLLSGLVLFLIGSVMSAVAGSAALLVVGRFVQAVGAGSGMTLVRTIARDAYGPERLVKAIAYLTMFYTLGPMVAPVVGGALVDTLGWRSVFGVALLCGALILIGAYAVVYETKPADAGKGASMGLVRSYVALFAHLRFSAFVLQNGFISGAFMAMASAASAIMAEYLHRPSTEFGLYFMLFPVGYFTGNFIASRVGNRLSTEVMVLAGSGLGMLACAVQAVVLLSGHASPLAIFLPGCFLTMGQGISLAYAQAGAMAIIPRVAGTAAGVGVFLQFFGGALFAQLYGALADGTPTPMVITVTLAALLAITFGAIPYLTRRSGKP